MKRIYLDYAATSPLKKEVAEAFSRALKEYFGNPSGIYREGAQALAEIDFARERIAQLLEVLFEEIIFCGGGSEALNLAIRGVVNAWKKKRGKREKPTLIISEVEHAAVLKTCQALENAGEIELKQAPVNRNGEIIEEKLLSLLDSKTALVVLIYVQNEIGVVEPIKKLIRSLKEHSKVSFPILIDAVQAFEYFDCRPNRLGADLLVLSPHKFGGPKGIGILYRKLGVELLPIITGGEQEFGLRAGTENTPAIIATRIAMELAADPKRRAERREQVFKKRDFFISFLKATQKEMILLGEGAERAPHIIGVAFKDMEGRDLVIKLDLRGISASAGSACASKAPLPSRMPKLLSLPKVYEKGFLRFSLSEETTERELERVAKILREEIGK